MGLKSLIYKNILIKTIIGKHDISNESFNLILQLTTNTQHLTKITNVCDVMYFDLCTRKTK